MFKMRIRSVLIALTTSVALVAFASDLKRSIPQPLAGHPGNVFLEGEEVVVKLPQSEGGWRLIDYDDRVILQARPMNGEAHLGKLPVGFYRLFRSADSNWVSLAVLKPLKEPTPLSSPICLDVAMAWFYPEDKMAAVSSLCALAGVNRTRDRLNWAEVEPEKGKFVQNTRYDSSALYQKKAGLQTLQVNHITPRWATKTPHRFPPDLRDAYSFYYEMAKRWRGLVQAFEPWNEADIPNFGGHTGAEMASFQKAAYLGMKKGNPKLTVCLNVFAVHNRAQLEDFSENRATAYFDTYNFHHYEPFDNYPALYADHKVVCGGKPLWVSEAALPVKWSGDANLKELSEENLKLQAERVVKTFACSLNEGSAATYYFLLPHYVEGQVQFGLLRPDITPRPGYVALAACGRLLADAKPLGRWQDQSQDLRAFLFDSKPDGIRRAILVLWSAKADQYVKLPAKPVAIYDHLGRDIPFSKAIRPTGELKVSQAPLFLLFDQSDSEKFTLQKSVQNVVEKREKPSPIVLQSIWDAAKTDWKNSAYKTPKNAQFQLPIIVYNFGEKPAKGRLKFEAPEGWIGAISENVQLNPMERKEIMLTLSPKYNQGEKTAKIKIEGDFGYAGKAVLSVRLDGE
ncbi:MAG: hypothetical protein ACP5T0_11170 [Verrucomicrobiia bacterium]